MRLRRVSVLTCGVILVGIAAWVLLSGPMLINFRTGPLSGDRRLTVLNPIRNRAPERYATGLLAEIQSGACQQAMAGVGISELQKAEACRKQEQDPVTTCRLVERSDKGTSSWLLFHCTYRRPTDARAEVGLTVERMGAQCQLRSYERIY